MTEFRVEDRVRVRPLPATGAYAGRTGAVVSVKPDPLTGAVLRCRVRLDGEQDARAVFNASELEPQAAGAFAVGDRVRVRPEPGTVFGGMAGAVVHLDQGQGGEAFSCRVLLDCLADSLPHGIPFHPDELEHAA